jgi:hypothetical protein
MPRADAVAYFVPKTMDITEILSNGASAIKDSQVVSMVPLDGQILDNDLVWRSTGLLEPSVSTASISFQRQKSTDDFYAGLAFATAASAFIALVQELPRPEKQEEKTEASPKTRRNPESTSDEPTRQT